MKVKIENCPLCYSKDSYFYISVQDFNVSKEKFDIYQCKSCDLLYTNDIPDQDAIGQYYKYANYVSHTDTRESFFYQMYHKVRSIMLYLKHQWIKSYKLKGKKVLDIGSGTGAFLSYMRAKGWVTTGIEADTDARRNALKLHNIESLPPSFFYNLSELYDVISLWHVLEHLHDLDGYLSKIKQILDPNGILIIAVPNPTCYEAKNYREYWDGYDVPRHLYHFSPTSIDFLASKYNFTIVAKKRMWFDAIYSGILSEKHKGGFKLKGIWKGLISNLHALFDKDRTASITYILKHA
ncbi:MAG TPA: class I SAM-dependent methyltransferase [Saprospiraceae bacterium]|nr:class I SAM-dependent methyltransferase [Saprospiraceae bacterium]